MSDDEHFWFRPLRAVHRSGWTPPVHVALTLRQLATSAHPHETGGLLLGWWDDGLPVVTDAVELADQRATGNRWTRQPQAAQEALAAARARAAPDVGYIGDWHSHPADVGPSGRDLRQLKQDSADYDNALALVVVRHGGRLDTRLARHGHLTTAAMIQKEST